jgi:hypothetical protein
MFFGVTSINPVAEPEKYQDADLPGESFEFEFKSGDSIMVHQALIAESHAENTPVSM